MTNIVATSDLHGYLPVIPECDILLVAGDLGPPNHGYHHDMEYARLWLQTSFTHWLDSVPANHIVGIAGNHDFIAQHDPDLMWSLPWVYLQDEAQTVDGLNFYGSPYSGLFGRWAFMETEGYLSQRWADIPDNTDVLLTHGPAYGRGDRCRNGDRAGSRSLADRIDQISPSLHVSGHIHEDSGFSDGVTYNVAHINLRYIPTLDPVRITLDETQL